MEHGISWLNFLPGYQQIEAYLQSVQHHGVLGQRVVFQHVAAALLVMLVLFVVALIVRRDIQRAGDGAIVPGPEVSLRNIIESALEGLYNQMHQIIGADAKRYFPVIASLALFIFFSNILGLIPGFSPPTDNWNTTFACGLFVFLYYNYHGLRKQGLGHIAHMANPAGEPWGWFLAPLMFPIELVSHVARPFSLGVRLAANMMGDHNVLFAFWGLVPILVPLPFLALGLMVCLIQTLVFVLLTMIYIGLSVEDAHGHGDAHGGEHGHADTHGQHTPAHA